MRAFLLCLVLGAVTSIVFFLLNWITQPIQLLKEIRASFLAADRYSVIFQIIFQYFSTLFFILFTGHRRVEDYKSDTTYFQQLQLGYWKDLLAERQKELEAKKKFIGFTFSRLLWLNPIMSPNIISIFSVRLRVGYRYYQLGSGLELHSANSFCLNPKTKIWARKIMLFNVHFYRM